MLIVAAVAHHIPLVSISIYGRVLLIILSPTILRYLNTALRHDSSTFFFAHRRLNLAVPTLKPNHENTD